jgi:site-specific DNA-cytosine methylase
MHINAIDLFSGLGGISYALKDIVKTVAYCDNEQQSRDVLLSRMESGHIARAPICNDVKKLTKTWLKKNNRKKPEAILAGFPCTGFSSAGKKNGFENDDSALFFEILRIIDTFPSINILFLENVPAVLRGGMPDIINELCTRRGFNIRWCILPATSVGAPHQRNRWYAIAHKEKFTDLTSIEWGNVDIPTTWATGKIPVRMVKNRPPNRNARSKLLGNSVVPIAIRTAYRFLCSNNPSKEKPIKEKLANIAGLMLSNGKWVYREYDTASSAVKSLLHVDKKYSFTLDPNIYQAPPGSKRTDKTLVVPVKKTLLATPTATSFRSTYFLTNRTKDMLATQIRFEKNTPHALRPYYVNVKFVEWMMGYPADYTLAKLSAKKIAM